MYKMRMARTVAVSLTAVTALAGCSSTKTGSASSKTITVAYQTTASFSQMQNLMTTAKSQFEAAHAGVKVKLEPIQAEPADYYTKLALLDKAPSTAPDVQYEDTFKIQTDAAAGYLLSLDSSLKTWPGWSQFSPNAKQAGLGEDSQTYGVSLGTDTRALWYNKVLFAKAGLPVPWAPKSWSDVLSAASAIKAKLPGIIPLNVYSGTAAGEGSTAQGFEMLLYGTGNQLIDPSTKKWVTNSPGFVSSLNFIKSVYQGGLGPRISQALDPNIFTNISNVWLPKSQLAIALDGSWQSGSWIKGGTAPWPAWSTTLGTAAFPTEHGQAPGSNSMSGGWTLAIGKHTSNPALAMQFLETALNKENSESYAVADSQIAVRNDVAKDPAYAAANPSFAFFSTLVPVTHFRPASTPYSQISNAIQVAMESVMTGKQSPSKAAAQYDSSLKTIVGEKNTQAAQ